MTLKTCPNRVVLSKPEYFIKLLSYQEESPVVFDTHLWALLSTTVRTSAFEYCLMWAAHHVRHLHSRGLTTPSPIIWVILTGFIFIIFFVSISSTEEWTISSLEIIPQIYGIYKLILIAFCPWSVWNIFFFFFHNCAFLFVKPHSFFSLHNNYF